MNDQRLRSITAPKLFHLYEIIWTDGRMTPHWVPAGGVFDPDQLAALARVADDFIEANKALWKEKGLPDRLIENIDYRWDRVEYIDTVKPALVGSY